MAFSPALRAARPARFLRALSVVLAAAALLTACKKPAITDPNDANFVVADQGSWAITRGQLNSEIDTFLKQKGATREMVGPANMPYVETAMLKNLVLKKLLLAKGASMQLKDVDKDTATELSQAKGPMSDTEFSDQLKKAGMTLDDLKQRIHDAVVIHKVLEAEAFKDSEPSEAEIDALYEKNKDKFNIPAKLRARRVLILTSDKDTKADTTAKKKQIEAARARVVKGEDFAKVATDVSQDRYSAPKGGDIGYFARGENEPGFDDVAFQTKVNAVSPVFQTQLGLQFVKIIDSQPAGVVSLADARAIIAPKLKEARQGEQAQAYAKKLVDDSGVKFHLKLVDPPAQMAAPGAGGAGGAGGVAPSSPAPASAQGAEPMGTPSAGSAPPPDVTNARAASGAAAQ